MSEETGSAEQSELEADADGDSDSDQSGRNGRATTLAVLVAIIVLALGSAVWFAIESSRLRASDAVENSALVDNAATAELVEAVSDATKGIFSYDYNNIARTERAAQDFLVDNAVSQYQDSFAAAKEQAAAQQSVRTTSARSVGVRELHENDARVLVVLDQQNVSAGQDHESMTSVVRIDVKKVDGRWKMANLEAL